jgi:hypothetical protein
MVLTTALIGSGMALPKGKSFTPEQNARVRAAARKLVAANGDNITRTADQLGITQAGLSSFLGERTGAGPQLATAIARRMRISLQMLIDGREDIPEPPESPVPLFGNLEGYAEQERIAREIAGPTFPAAAFERVRGWAGVLAPGELTPQFILGLAMVARGALLDPTAAQRASAKIDAQIKGDKTRTARRLKREHDEREGRPLALEPPAPKKTQH